MPPSACGELEPTNSSTHSLLAQALWGAQLPQEALREAKRALELANDDLDRAMAQRLVADYSSR